MPTIDQASNTAVSLTGLLQSCCADGCKTPHVPAGTGSTDSCCRGGSCRGGCHKAGNRGQAPGVRGRRSFGPLLSAGKEWVRPNAASACRARNCNKALGKHPRRSAATPAPLLLQALNRPQSRAETDAFNKMHFQQLRLARQHSHRPTAVTPKVICSACTLQLPGSQSPPRRGSCGLCTEGACALSSFQTARSCALSMLTQPGVAQREGHHLQPLRVAGDPGAAHHGITPPAAASICPNSKAAAGAAAGNCKDCLCGRVAC